MAFPGGHSRGASATSSGVPDQLTGQMLEENPVLPLDTQSNLVFTLTRIFRVLAQIVNPLVAWAARWAGIEPSGGAWGNVLIIKATPPTTGKGAALILQAAAPDGTGVLAADRPAGTRLWNVVMPTASAAGDFAIERLPTTAQSFTALSIKRADGTVDVASSLAAAGGVFALADRTFGLQANASFPSIRFSADATPRRLELDRSSGAFYFTDNGNTVLFSFAANGDFNATGRVTGANGMGMMWDGGGANYLCMGAGMSPAWSWQYERSTGTLRWYNWEPREIFRIEGGGKIWCADRADIGGGLGVAGGNIDVSNGYVWASGSLRTSGHADIAAHCSANYHISNSFTGVRVNGTNGVAGQYTYQDIAVANPSWAQLEFRSWHQAGQWAGFAMQGESNPTNVIQFVMSNGTNWGLINAAAFNVQSDERGKEYVAPLEQQHDAFMGIVPIKWHWPTPPQPKDGDAPIYPDLREQWGFSAQNLSKSVALAVNGDVRAIDADGNAIGASVNPVPISALTVLEVQALWERVTQLESRVAELEAA